MRGIGYAIIEIIWWMLAAAVLGVIIGWILRGRRLSADLEAWAADHADQGDPIIAAGEPIDEPESVLEAEPLAIEPDDPVVLPEPEPEPAAEKTDPAEELAEESHLPDKETATAMMAEIAARTRGTGPRVEDDLKLIHGVGPKLDGLLKSMDITSFRQVALFTSDDIAYVTAALDAFPGRIERDDWMSSAAEQHELKYGDSTGPVSDEPADPWNLG